MHNNIPITTKGGQPEWQCWDIPSDELRNIFYAWDWMWCVEKQGNTHNIYRCHWCQERADDKPWWHDSASPVGSTPVCYKEECLIMNELAQPHLRR